MSQRLSSKVCSNLLKHLLTYRIFLSQITEILFSEFRSCCTCTDGCKPETCECMQLTFEGYKKTQQFSEKCTYIRKKLNDKEITQAEHDGKPQITATLLAFF